MGNLYKRDQDNTGGTTQDPATWEDRGLQSFLDLMLRTLSIKKNASKHRPAILRLSDVIYDWWNPATFCPAQHGESKNPTNGDNKIFVLSAK